VTQRSIVRSYGPNDTEAAFLLGGIGTGNFSLGARGEFRDWELFNQPGKGNQLPFTFAAIRTAQDGDPADTRVLEARRQPPFGRSHGLNPWEVGGLPRFADTRLRAEYPFAWVEFDDDTLPVSIRLEAFTPFIPLDADDSGLPAAVLRYRVANTSLRPVDVSVALSLANAVGFAGSGPLSFPRQVGRPANRFRNDGAIRGIEMTSDLPPNDPRTGTMALLTRDPEVSYKAEWFDGFWWDGIGEFWDDFRSDGRLQAPLRVAADPGRLAAGSGLRIGSIAIDHRLEVDEQHEFEFVLAWHFPNRPRSWGGEILPVPDAEVGIVRNHYATRFGTAWDVGSYLFANLERLERTSRSFQETLFESTYPPEVLEALAAGITVLRSPTCFRIEDGTFLGWEGCHDDRGSCEGNCTHVWNYAQTAAFLFPSLEQSMRRVEFLLETDPFGQMSFRTNRVFGLPPWDMLAAADGQLGTIVRAFRDWKLSGDEAFLRDIWPGARRALAYASRTWDPDGDGVLEATQHTTYDVELHGPNPLTTGLYIAALLAAAEVEDHLGNPEIAANRRATAAQGMVRMDELLWNGEYYVQRLGIDEADRYQIGTGCLSDQLLSQSLARVAGLDRVVTADRARSALGSIFRRNFKRSLEGHHNVARTFALEGEPGLLLCSWPNGDRPRFPMPYSDEVWSGVEYQVAAGLIFEGLVDEGLALVRAVRERHDGRRRNPWNEAECGHHYVRSMASWAVLLALSGFRCDLVAGEIVIDPVTDIDDFRTFWSCGRAWGRYRRWRDTLTGDVEETVDVLYGDLAGARVNGVVVAASSEPAVVK
jgi:uncharacterized protein (DUF608 family)